MKKSLLLTLLIPFSLFLFSCGKSEETLSRQEQLLTEQNALIKELEMNIQKDILKSEETLLRQEQLLTEQNLLIKSLGLKLLKTSK